MEKSKINASGRRDILGLNRLVTNQRLLEAAYRILPNSVIRTVRKGLERLVVKNLDRKRGGAGRTLVTQEERLLLEKFLAADTEYYRAITAAGRWHSHQHLGGFAFRLQRSQPWY